MVAVAAFGCIILSHNKQNMLHGKCGFANVEQGE
jgi:hypothetical protein